MKASTKTKRNPTAAKKVAPALRRALRRHTHAAYREAIMEAAAELFGKVGFSDARMSDIAAQAGVSVGTLYNCFDSKDDVIEALRAHKIEALQAALGKVSRMPDPCKRLRSLIETAFTFVEQHGPLMARAMQSGLLDQEVATKRRNGTCDGASVLVELYRKAFAQAAKAGQIRRDLDPAQLTVALDGIVSALAYDWVRSGQKRSLTAQTDFVFNLLMKGTIAK
jgi:AcrR family transcriptional regulator